MASVSFSVTNNGDDTSNIVTQGTSAPSAGDLSVEIDLTKKWTKRSVKTALERVYRFIQDASDTSVADA